MKREKNAWGKVLLFLLLTLSALTVFAGAHESDPLWELPELVYLEEGPGSEVALQGAPDVEGAFEALYAGITDLNSEINLAEYGISVESSQQLRDMLYYQCPELFHFSGNWTGYTSNGIVIKVLPVYTMSASEYASARSFYDQELDGIVGLVDESWSDLEKVLFVHDYLAAHYEYDLTYSIYDTYHFFAENTGVCQAYTLAYTAILQEMNLDVSYVSSSNLNHIWNVVKLDGSWYHVDVTHDDPVKDYIGVSRHGHFLRSDSGLEGHDVDRAERDWEYGISEGCTDTRYDSYFWKDTVSPFTNVDGVWYFIESDSKQTDQGLQITDSRLMKWDGEHGNGNETIVGGFQSPGTGLGYFAGKLYFSSFYSLRSYDLQEGRLSSLLSTGTYIYGSRLEQSGEELTLKYRVYENGSLVTKTLSIDPYIAVDDGGYGYYQQGGSLHIKLDGTGAVAVAQYDGKGKMLRLDISTDVGTWSVAPDAETKEFRIFAVHNTVQWIARCAARSLTA